MKKTLLNFILICYFAINQAQASDADTTQDRTKLIEFIIQAEGNIKEKNKEVSDLWYKCFEYKTYCDGYDIITETNTRTGYQNTQIIPRYRSKVERRASCTNDDINVYEKCKADLPEIVKQTVNSIKTMAESEELHINAKDSQGKAAQNYCYTYEIYQELCRQGAEFQCAPYMHFDRSVAGAVIYITGTALAIGTIVSIMYYIMVTSQAS
ncbi:MAG: hypothetical protein Q8Q60_03605 [Candidatus Chromulinivorax sp.]|nr:hypothetical protein [Candidatus Chromulinivorax sp.]